MEVDEVFKEHIRSSSDLSLKTPVKLGPMTYVTGISMAVHGAPWGDGPAFDEANLNADFSSRERAGQSYIALKQARLAYSNFLGHIGKSGKRR